mgnify:CR=1 FL=1
MKHLNEKVAIITGSSSGIGKAIALRLGEEGVKIAVAARRLDLCNTVKDQILARGGKAIAVQTDISDQTQIDNLIDETIDHFGQIDIMVKRNLKVGNATKLPWPNKYFDLVVGGDTFVHKKPHPSVLNNIMFGSEEKNENNSKLKNLFDIVNINQFINTIIIPNR